jgi:membrane-associated HD superfamily phosphohydrolase
MDEAQDIKFQTLLERIIDTTGKTGFLYQIKDLSKRNNELLQKLVQISDTRDKILRSFDEASNLRKVEIILGEQQGELKKEIKQNIELLTRLQKIDIPKKMQEQQIAYERKAKRWEEEVAPYQTLTEHIDLPSESDYSPEQLEAIIEEIKESSKGQHPDTIRAKDILKEMEENNGHSIDETTKMAEDTNKIIDEADRQRREMIGAATKLLESQQEFKQTIYQAWIAQAAFFVHLLRTLFKKYTFQRYTRSLRREGIRIFFLLIIGVQAVGLLLSQVNLLWLGSLLLPTFVWIFTEYVFEPYLDKRLFIKKREDMKQLLAEFYKQSFFCRCYLALAQDFVDKLERSSF